MGAEVDEEPELELGREPVNFAVALVDVRVADEKVVLLPAEELAEAEA